MRLKTYLAAQFFNRDRRRPHSQGSLESRKQALSVSRRMQKMGGLEQAREFGCSDNSYLFPAPPLDINNLAISRDLIQKSREMLAGVRVSCLNSQRPPPICTVILYKRMEQLPTGNDERRSFLSSANRKKGLRPSLTCPHLAIYYPPVKEEQTG